MRNNGNPKKGNTKKFLYTGPQREDQSDDWLFSPRQKNDTSPRADGGLSDLDMENVWSIKKNVSLGGATGSRMVTNGNSDGLNLKANRTYYSRYGGGVKGKDEFGSLPTGPSGSRLNHTDSSGNSRSWNYTSKGFSYSSFSGNSQPSQAQGGPTSPTRQSPPYSNFTSKANNDSEFW